MKAKPFKRSGGEYCPVPAEHATHVLVTFPKGSPTSNLFLPVKEGVDRTYWKWNGDTENPTLSPSIRTQGVSAKTGKSWVCHSWIRNGKIQFCSDSTHSLAGKTVRLPEVDWL